MRGDSRKRRDGKSAREKAPLTPSAFRRLGFYRLVFTPAKTVPKTTGRQPFLRSAAALVSAQLRSVRAQSLPPEFYAFLNRRVIRHVIHTHALMGMRPALRRAGEEEVARHHQHAALFQSLIEQFGRDRQILKPEPEENSAFRFVDQAALFRQIAAQNGDGFLHALLIEGLDHRFRQAQQVAALDHLYRDRRADAARRR